MTIKRTQSAVLNDEIKAKPRRCLAVLTLFFFMIFPIFFITCQPKEKQEKTYYISSSTGDDDFDGLSELTPFKSFKNFKELVFIPGDKILLKRGDQFDGLYLEDHGNGTEENPIILGAYGDNNLPKPILNAKGRKVKALYISNLSHWTIQDLKIQGSKSHQFVIDPKDSVCEGIKILRCHVNGAMGKNAIRFQTNPSGPEYYGCRNIEIAHCFIENAGQGVDDVSDGINAPNIQLNVYIHHNEFFNNVSEAIDIGAGKNHVIEYNKVDGNGFIHSGGIKTHVQTGNKIHDTENVIIRYNIIYDCIQHGIQIQDARNVKVYNNTVYQNNPNSKVALLLGTANDDQYQPDDWIAGNEITNNIFFGNTYRPKQTVIRFTGSKLGGPSTIWNDTANFKIQNNIIYGGEDEKLLLVRVLDDPTIDFLNIPEEGKRTFDDFSRLHVNNIMSNPNFKDPGHQDFSLLPGSPGIDQGIQHEVKADLLGNSIIANPDLGAIENNPDQ